MMPIGGKSHSPCVHGARLHGARRPMVDAANGWISEPLLKSFRILSKIMQQPGQFRFGAKAERCSKFFRQQRDVAKMLGEQLPFILWQAVAFVIFSRVREEFHALFPNMFPPALGCLPTPGRKG